MRNHCHSNSFSSNAKVLFLSCYFQNFFLSLFFRIFTVVCLGVVFFGLIPFVVHLASWTYKFMSFAKFWKFPAILLLKLFQSSSPILSFWESDDMNFKSCIIAPQISEDLFFFFFFFSLFLICSDWIISIFLSSSLFILSFVFFILFLSSSTKFLYFGLSYFQF